MARGEAFIAVRRVDTRGKHLHIRVHAATRRQQLNRHQQTLLSKTGQQPNRLGHTTPGRLLTALGLSSASPSY
jgi:hypothetical protein